MWMFYTWMEVVAAVDGGTPRRVSLRRGPRDDVAAGGDRERELLDALGMLVGLAVQVEVGAQRRTVRTQVARVLRTAAASYSL